MTEQNQNEQQENPSEGKTFDLFDGEPIISFDGTVINGDIIISPARGTYAASLGEPSNLEWVEKYLHSNRESYPDIDGNFVNGDRDRAEVLDQLEEKYGNPDSHEQPNPESSVLDGYSDKEDIIRKAREAEDNFRIRNADWFNSSIGTNHFFR
jgi:hypothetical protein